MPEGTDDPRLSAEGELALARLALAEGDLEHAANHLAGAIAYAPTMPEVHEALAQLAARTGGGVDLFPLDQHPFIGTVVARAHLLAAAGRPGEGLELLAAATGHAPLADWADVPWVSAPDLPNQLDPDRIARVLMQVCAGIPDPVPEPAREPLWPYLRLARHAVAAHPEHGLLLGAASALARRVGALTLAVDWASRAARELPSKLSEVWLGYAYRSAGRTDDALAALRRAVAHDPDDLSVYADIAGTLADHGQLDEALDWIDRALARDPGFDCAVHTGHRLRYRQDGELRHLVALADFQREHPDDSHEHTDLAECCHAQPWLGRVPPAGEPAVATLRNLLGSGTPVTAAELRLTGAEPPSAVRALLREVPDLPIPATDAPAAQLHEPRRPVTRPLWRYDGGTPMPALPPPSASAVDRIQRLAHPAWPHPPAAYDAAVALATMELDDLLGLLVHPPPPPNTELGRTLHTHDPTLWVRCVQVWVCLGLLHHRTDEPWPESTRRGVLLDLVWDVEDWISEAALFALVTAAWVEPALRVEVARISAERLADAVGPARRRPATITRSLAHLVLATPQAEPAAVEAARHLLLGGGAGRRVSGPGRVSRFWRWLWRRG